MAKVKSSNVPHYELLYIISNKFSENEVPPIKDMVEKLITDNEGEITFKQDWGKKKLAYTIKHFRHGYYQLLEFDLPADKLKIVENILHLSDEILRYQIVKKTKGEHKAGLAEVTRAQEEAEEKEAETGTETKEAKKEVAKKTTKAETKVEEKTATTPKEKESTPIQPKTESTKEEPKKDKVNMEDLDDKLDKILDSESFF